MDTLRKFLRIASLFPAKGKKVSDPLSTEAIIWAYRLFLDREPESAAAIQDKLNRLRTTREIRSEFLGSEEFMQANVHISKPPLTGFEPAMEIEDLRTDKDLQALLAHIQEVWQQLGEDEPYWSVLSSEAHKKVNIEKTIDMFYQSGKPDVERLFKTFERNRVDASGFTTCLEYGCGLGRVTRWLADRFASVTACDISASHLRPAKEYLDRQGITNVSFTLISQVQDIEKLPPVDLIYSVIVLQHNPPPVIELILRQFMKSLNPGGVAYFQLPTYLMGYSFSQENYLSEHGARREMEMHYFPQKKVFEIIRQEGGKLIEVMEDAWTGGRYKEVSNTFLVQKE